MVGFLRQLLPLTYRSKYIEDGKNMFCVWRMWFGQSFDIEKYEIVVEGAP